LLLSGRIGAGIGAELGAMKVTEQIDASSACRRLVQVSRGRVVACAIAANPDEPDELHRHARRVAAEHAMLAWGSFSTGRSRSFSSRPDSGDAENAVFGFLIATVSSYLGVNAQGGTEGLAGIDAAWSCRDR
jgi:phospholipid/cholesterol/gamma-HCH transport system permease protein